MFRSLVAWLLMLAAFLILVVRSCNQTPLGPPLTLEPNDARPIAQIRVTDAAEVGLLRQELSLEVVGMEGDRLYFIDEPKLRERLASVGYAPATMDPYQIFHRVARIGRKGKEDTLLRSGVQLLKRENAFWVVRGSLAQLESLKAQGYRLQHVNDADLRPRQIRVVIPDYDAARKIAASEADIINVSRDGRRLVLFAGALDYQIDHIRAMGFDVEVLTPGEKRTVTKPALHKKEGSVP